MIQTRPARSSSISRRIAAAEASKPTTDSVGIGSSRRKARMCVTSRSKCAGVASVIVTIICPCHPERIREGSTLEGLHLRRKILREYAQDDTSSRPVAPVVRVQFGELKRELRVRVERQRL